jgi:hypothetical protein
MIIDLRIVKYWKGAVSKVGDELPNIAGTRYKSHTRLISILSPVTPSDNKI